jgi:hypothetical protein
MTFKVPAVLPRSRNSIDRWADGFLAKHYPNLLDTPGRLPVLELLDIVLFRDYGISSGVESLPPGVEGVVYAGIVNGVARDRFTGAHEVFHAVQHLRELKVRYESAGRLQLFRRKDMPAYRDPEWQADWAAAALLMPARVVWRLIADNGPRPDVLQDAFGVGFQSACIRIEAATSGGLWRPG